MRAHRHFLNFSLIFKHFRWAFLSFFCFSLMTSVTLAETDRISAEEFVSSAAGELFQAGDYERALDATKGLLETFPGDPLLRRYQAIMLDRLGNSEEAIQIFQDLLSEDPRHIPTHYFLAEAFNRQGKKEAAIKEWQYVVTEGEGSPYSWWAAEAIQREGLEEPLPKRAGKKAKKWAVSFRTGYEYDSNVIVRPEDKSLSRARDQNAGRYTANLGMNYRAYSRRDVAVDLSYSSYQSLHDDGLNEFNFHSDDFGIRARKKMKVGEKDVILGARYNAILSFLDGDLFSYRNRWTLEADSRLSEHTRTVVYDRMTHGEYGPDGFDHSITSRDGFYNDFGLTQYLYSDDFSTFGYFQQEFNHGHTTGSNFDFVGTTSRVGVHVPIVKKKLDLDTSSGLTFKHYHNFESLSSRDTSKRRDVNWDIYTAVTYSFTPEIQLRGFYRYVNAQNRNDFYDYRRHVGGTQLTYRLRF